MVNQGYQTFRQQLPPVLRNLLPERATDLLAWYGGLVVGVIRALVGFLPLSWILDVFELLGALIEGIRKHGLNLSKLWQEAAAPFASLLQLFQQDVDLSPFDRGELAGTVWGTLVGLIVVVVLAIFTAGGMAPLLAGIARNLKEVVERIWGAFEKLRKQAPNLWRGTQLAGKITVSTVKNTLPKGKQVVKDALAKSRGADRGRIREKRLQFRVHHGKQAKHRYGHNDYTEGRSILTHPTPQSLVNRYAGTGVQMGPVPVGQPGSKELVDFHQPIGVWKAKNNPEGKVTTKGVIHYAREGVHIVPAHP